MPPLLVGREDVLEELKVLLDRFKHGLSGKSIMLYGLRGVGKTVLLTQAARYAKDHGFHIISLEASEGNAMAPSIIQSLKRILYELKPVSLVRHALMVLCSFIKSVKLGSIEVGVEAAKGYADSGNLPKDLTDLFVAVGTAAKAAKAGITIIVDEVHTLNKEDFCALITAMHKMQQDQLPITLIAAGLPTLVRIAGEARSYAERLFNMREIGNLSYEDAAKALEGPLHTCKASISADALQYIIEHVHGYPYFLQEWGAKIWNQAASASITLNDVISAKTKVYHSLDESFYRVRYDRLTMREKEFMRSMAILQAESVTINDLAKVMETKVTSLSTIRDRLIQKGMIYSPKRGYLTYSVPLFGDYLLRTLSDMQ